MQLTSGSRARAAWCGAVVLAGIGLFAGYLLQARTYQVNSDGAGNALQAWDMLHGNALLHGWWLSDVSFYTTELPEYVLVETIFGLRPDVVDISAALTYTLLVLAVALVAKGSASGREGVFRALLAGGIMAAPGLGNGTYAVLSSPDHIGTAVPIMVTLFVLDRLDRPGRAGRYLPLLVLVLLAWVQVADEIATLAAAIPIALVCAIRAGRSVLRRTLAWDDLLLCAAALVSIPVAAVTLSVLQASGGFYLHPYPGPLTSHVSQWSGQARVLGDCLLTLFGADVNYGLGWLRIAGLAVALLGLLAGLGLFFARLDRVSQVLVVSVLLVLAAAQFSTAMTTIISVREIVTVLPASAVLAGRVIGPWLARAGLNRPRLKRVATGALGAGLAVYLAALGYSAAQPAVPAENQALADWLWAHGLRYGLAGYWEADSVTLDSGERVRIAPIFGGSPYRWESRPAWYDPRVSYANFVVTVPPGVEQYYARPGVIRRVFGPPAQVYHFQQYTILVFDRNLLNDLSVPPALPPAATIAGGPLSSR